MRYQRLSRKGLDKLNKSDHKNARPAHWRQILPTLWVSNFRRSVLISHAFTQAQTSLQFSRKWCLSRKQTLRQTTASSLQPSVWSQPRIPVSISQQGNKIHRLDLLSSPGPTISSKRWPVVVCKNCSLQYPFITAYLDHVWRSCTALSVYRCIDIVFVAMYTKTLGFIIAIPQCPVIVVLHIEHINTVFKDTSSKLLGILVQTLMRGKDMPS